MRVVQLITQDRGGPVDHAVDVARELARRGHDSHLVGPPGEYAVALADTSVGWHEATMANKLDVRGAASVLRTLTALRPDVVHLQDRRAGMLGRLAARPAGFPCVYTLHGLPYSLWGLVRGNLAIEPSSRAVRLGNVPGERWLDRIGGSAIVAPCSAMADYVVEHVGIPRERVTVVYNGFTPADPAAGPVVRHRRDGSPLRVAWLGLMWRVKRVPALVRAVAQVPDVELLLVGDGEERPLVEAAIAATGTGDRIQLAGFHSAPESLLAKADAFVLPSAAETFPMALLQAMSLGLPVLASAAAGIPELVRDGVDGVLVPTGDDTALRVALAELAADDDARLWMGHNAFERVRDFSSERCVDDLIEVYERCAR